MKSTTFSFFIIALILVNFSGLLNGVFMEDSALYAQISKSFVTTHNWWDIYVNGHDWLDKPHFPFWICALSMQIFGINAFAYKLPSLLFFLLALYYTYLFAKKYYPIDVARISVLIVASSTHIILSNNDTRAEAMLIALVIGSVYYLILISETGSFKNIFLGSLFCAAAIMTKGIFVLIIIYTAIFGHLFFKKEFSKLFSMKWVWFFTLTLILILPEMYALYFQFDLHPDKIVFGKNHVSGIRFFLWDSQFGRFFNSGPIKGDGDPFFFFHTLLWAFAPWSVVGYMSLYAGIAALIKRRPQTEYISLLGFTVMFIVFSVSKFQLPHYTNILFPFLSIICAQYIWNNRNEAWFIKTFSISQSIFFVVYIVVLGLELVFFRAGNWLLTGFIFTISIFSIVLAWLKTSQKLFRFFYISIIFSMLFFLYMNFVFYPTLLSYQSASNAAIFLNKNYQEKTVVSLVNNPLLSFSTNRIVKPMSTTFTNLPDSDINGKIFYYVDQTNLDSLSQKKLSYKIIHSFEGFHITQINAQFFNYKTRNESLEKTYLLELEKHE